MISSTMQKPYLLRFSATEEFLHDRKRSAW